MRVYLYSSVRVNGRSLIKLLNSIIIITELNNVLDIRSWSATSNFNQSKRQVASLATTLLKELKADRQNVGQDWWTSTFRQL